MTQEEVLAQLYSLVVKPGGGDGDVQKDIAQVLTPSAANAGGVSASRMSDQLAQMVQQLELLKTVQQSHADLLGENTKVIAANTASKAGPAVSDAAKGAAGTLLSGFGLSPIVSGLLKLFGGGSQAPAEIPVTKYAAPDAVQLDAGLVGGDRLTTVDRGAGDRIRAIDPPRATTSTPAANITVQVNAMDSRSFLDRSDEIAKAVRLAMLESHSINDVVAEL